MCHWARATSARGDAAKETGLDDQLGRPRRGVVGAAWTAEASKPRLLAWEDRPP